jgi:hypothetical protein
VFCSHGSGYYVSWDQVKDHIHVESVLKKETREEFVDPIQERKAALEDQWMDTEEIDQILEQTFYANQHHKSKWKKKKVQRIAEDYKAVGHSVFGEKEPGEITCYVDGYNIIYAWKIFGSCQKKYRCSQGKLQYILCDLSGGETV